MSQTTKWNKLQAHASFDSDMNEKATLLIKSANKIGVDLKARSTPLTEEEVQKLWNDDDTYHALVDLLNSIEDVSARFNTGTLDPDAAYSNHSLIVMNYYKVYKRMIDKFKERYGEEAFVEWEKLAQEWAHRRKSGNKQSTSQTQALLRK